MNGISASYTKYIANMSAVAYTFHPAGIGSLSALASMAYNDSLESSNGTNGTLNPRLISIYEPPYSIFQMVIIAIVAGILSMITVIGNIMVMISFKMDKQLQTISNYFLLSLAVADFSIGLISMPLFTMYLLMGYWPLGDFICDTWLAFDYLNSNASVLNLLIISFDRYFSVTRPLTYRALRTTRRAAFMIASAWIISLMLWPPWIYSWPYIEGARTVKKGQCYIQFLETNSYVTFGTALAAFYVPVTVMIFLYWRIWRETMQRQKDLTHLQAGKKETSKKSTSSDDPPEAEELHRPENNRRSRNDSRVLEETLETTYVPTSLCVETLKYLPKTGKSKQWKISETLMSLCKLDRDDDAADEDDSSHGSAVTTPASMETSMQSCSRTESMSFRVDHLVQVHPTQSLSLPSTSQKANDRAIPMTERNGPRKSESKILDAKHQISKASSVAIAQTTLVASSSMSSTSQALKTTAASIPSAVRSPPPTPPTQAITAGSSGQPSIATESIYTILIRLPKKPASADEEDDCQASIKMIMEKDEEEMDEDTIETLEDTSSLEAGLRSNLEGIGCRKLMKSGDQSADTVGLPLNTKLVHKQVVKHRAPKRKRKQQERKQDMKAAKTLSAILLAFAITWTPYNVLVLWKTLSDCKGDYCIPLLAWNISYYLCYINSTVNPLCYALGNANFRRTYMRILKCKWYNKRQRAAHRGYFS